MEDYGSLLDAIKQVDVVFSVMGHEPSKQLADQLNIVSAIKEAGNIKVPLQHTTYSKLQL